jgi:hypothetical protein
VTFFEVVIRQMVKDLNAWAVSAATVKSRALSIRVNSNSKALKLPGGDAIGLQILPYV